MKIALHKPLSVIAALFLAGFLAKPVIAADLLPLVTEGNASGASNRSSGNRASAANVRGGL